MNSALAPGAKASAQLNFSRADAADSTTLNPIMWRDRKGNVPMPPPQHKVFSDED
jgi:hypothetical protein